MELFTHHFINIPRFTTSSIDNNIRDNHVVIEDIARNGKLI